MGHLLCISLQWLHAEVPIELFGQDDLLSILWHESGGSCFIEAGQVDGNLGKEDLKIESLCSVFLVDKDDNSCGIPKRREYFA